MYHRSVDPLPLLIASPKALENRVAELEEENNALRAALSLPPANRPALGKGPTGKDKPKPNPGKSNDGQQGLAAVLSNMATTSGSMAPTSRTESPLSTGSASGQSMSPDPIGPGLSLPQTSPPNSLDPSAWNDPLFGDKDSDRSMGSTNFNLPTSSSHNSPFPQIPRSAASDIFSSGSGFPGSDDKSFGYLPPDERRTFNGYSHLLSGHPSTQSSLPPSLQSGGDESGLPSFLQRRALTEPDNFRTLLQMAQVSTQNGLQTPAPRMSANALLNVVDAPLSEFDLPGGAERRYPRLH